MASSRKSKPADPAALFYRQAREEFAKLPAGSRIVVGLSGGVDSVVLLDLACRLAARRRFSVRAIHINHQLQKPADAWARFCRRLCRARGVPLTVVRVDVPRGDSIEGAARALRYQHYFRQQADIVLLAHHADDQAETVLLQLLRGTGLRGMAAMPYGPREAGVRHRSEGPMPVIVRPLLSSTRADIETYARKRKLEWIEDPSNADIYYQRNFVRQILMPAVAERFPAYREALARAARHAGEAVGLLDELAAIDAGPDAGRESLDLRVLRAVSPARARNLLRHFLVSHGVAIPAAVRLDEALRQAREPRRDGAMTVVFGAHELKRHGDRLMLVPARATPAAGWSVEWDGQGILQLDENAGFLSAAAVAGEGISLRWLAGRRLTVRPRRGGERLKPAADRPTRTLKNLLQESRIPAWQRDDLPLIFLEDELVAIPGVAVAAACRAGPRETGMVPVWSMERPKAFRR